MNPALYFCDSDTRELGRRSWEAWLGNGSVEIAIDSETQSLMRNGQKAALDPTTLGIALFHTAYVQPATLVIVAAKYTRLILIAVSGNGITDKSSADTVYFVRGPVAKPTDSAFESRLKAFIEDFNIAGVPNYRLLEPDSTDALAFRLLCEAWLMTEGGGIDKYHGISVYAPTTAADWFGPFDESPNAEGVSRLMERMGDANKKHGYVEKVLREVVAGTLAWKTCQTLVKRLRDDLDVTAR